MENFLLAWQNGQQIVTALLLSAGRKNLLHGLGNYLEKSNLLKKSQAPFLSPQQNEPHRSGFLIQRSWLAPSWLCSSILALSLGQTPLPCSTHGQAQTNTAWELVTSSPRARPCSQPLAP